MQAVLVLVDHTFTHYQQMLRKLVRLCLLSLALPPVLVVAATAPFALPGLARAYPGSELPDTSAIRFPCKQCDSAYVFIPPHTHLDIAALSRLSNSESGTSGEAAPTIRDAIQLRFQQLAIIIACASDDRPPCHGLTRVRLCRDAI